MAGGARRGRPRSDRVDRTIRQEALRLLAERGYRAMSVEGVAAAAGVGKSTIYRRYRGKREMVLSALSAIAREAPRPPDTGDVEADLLRAATEALRFMQGINGFALIGALLLEEGRSPEFLELFRGQVLEPRHQVVRCLLERGARRGQIPAGVDLEVLTDCVMGAVLARHLRGLPTDEGWLRRLVRTLLGRGGGPPGGVE